MRRLNEGGVPEDFYGMNDLMGPQDMRLPKGYIKQVKDYQKVQEVTGDNKSKKK